MKTKAKAAILFIAMVGLISTNLKGQWSTNGNNIRTNSQYDKVGINQYFPDASLHVKDSTSNNVVSIFEGMDYSWNDLTQWRKDDSILSVVNHRGDFGIGELYPSSRLHVKSDSSTNTILENSWGSTSDIFQWRKEATILGFIDAAGHMGIGLSSTSAMFEINTDSQIVGQKINVSANPTVDAFKISFGGTDKFVINKAANVLSNYLNTSGKGYFGITKIGQVGFTNYAGFAYHDIGSNNYALLQSAQGFTYLNCKDNTTIYFREGNTNDVMRMSSAGLYIGGGAVTTKTLQLADDEAWKTMTNTWWTTSDRNMKQNIKAFESGIEIIRKLKPVSFNYLDVAGLPADERAIGLIAQEVKEIAPYMVKEHELILNEEEASTFKGEITQMEPRQELDSSGNEISVEQYSAKILGFNPHALFFLSINSIKALDEENATLKEELNLIKVEMSELRQLITGEESTLAGIEDEHALKQEFVLEQNSPNPFNEVTTIEYKLPVECVSPQLIVTDINGRIVVKQNIKCGQGKITLYAEDFGDGMYLYSIIENGKTLQSKKLIVNQ